MPLAGLTADGIPVTSFDTVIAGGNHTLALDQQGRLWAWGSNVSGQLGLRDNTDRDRPTLVPLTGLTVGGVPVTSFDAVMASGVNTLALDQQGRLWAWGSNGQGQLGLGDTTNRNTPTLVSLTGLSGVTSFDTVIAGGSSTFAFDQQGRLWAWGDNGGGRLGLGDTTHRNRPTLVSLTGLSGVTSFDAVIPGNGHALALDQGGRLWAWGNNTSGQLGIGGTTNAQRPTLVPLAGLSGVTSFDTVTAGVSYTLALDQQGRLWAWGLNTSGQLGDGTTIDRHRPVLISLAGLNGVTSFNTIIAGGTHAFALDQQGRLWSWGSNADGRLGLGDTNNRNRPTLVNYTRLTVESVTPGGINTAMDTDSLTITFTEPVSLATRTTGVVTIDREAQLGTRIWNTDGTQLTIPLTIAEDSYLSVHTVSIAGFASLSEHGGTMLPLTHHFRTPPRPFDSPQGSLAKMLTAPEGTPLPSATFAFSFTPKEVILNVADNIWSRDDGPAISDQTISIDSTTATTEAGTISASNYLELLDIFSTVSFPGGGVFVYEVAEVVSSSTLPGMQYDTSRFQVRLTVGNTGVIGAIEIFALMEYPADSNTWILDPDVDKLDSLAFTNVYTSHTELEITKTIAQGEFANLATDFDFEVVLVAPPLSSLSTTLTATIYSGTYPIDDPSRSPVVIGVGNIFSFTLRDGEKIVIPELPVGTTFSVTEAAHPEFAPSVEVYSIGVHIYSDMADINTALTTGQHILAGGGRNAADFTNTFQFIAPTGLVIANMSLALVLAVLLGLVMFVAYRKRRSIETLPLA